MVLRYSILISGVEYQNNIILSNYYGFFMKKVLITLALPLLATFVSLPASAINNGASYCPGSTSKPDYVLVNRGDGCYLYVPAKAK